jgi:hypothetical protein
MPESVQDRPASAVEYVFLLTKSSKYFYDAEAVKRGGEPYAMKVPDGWDQGEGAHGTVHRSGRSNGAQTGQVRSGRNFRNSDLFYDSLAAPHGLISDAAGHPLALDVNPAGFSAAHFATFPPRLVEPLIRAGTSEKGACSACGAPWVRVVERGDLVPLHPTKYDKRAYGVVRDSPDANDAGSNRARDGHRGNMAFERTTTGWRAGCQCEAPTRPCTILDPFCGAGTTLLVADRLRRDAIGIDLHTSYAQMAKARIVADAPLLTDWRDDILCDGGIADLFDPPPCRECVP